MKNTLYKVVIALGLLLGSFGVAWAAGLTVPQGGTGWTGFVAGTIPIGPGTGSTALRFATSTGFTFATSTNTLTVTYASTTALSGTSLCLSTDCRTAWPSSSFPFTPSANYNATSTVIGFLAGLFSNSSTTLNGAIRFPSLSDGGLAVFSGLVSSGATTTAGTGLTYSGNAFSITAPVTIALGGTNATSFTTTNNAVYYDGTRLVTAGTSQAVTTPFASSTGITIASALYIPNAADPSVTTLGQVAINTTAASTSIRYHDGTAERVLNGIYTKSTGPVASSTLAYNGAFGASGTTSLLYMNAEHPFTVVSARCKTDTGTAYVQFSDGTNLSTIVPCTTSGANTTISSNGSFTEGLDFKINFGSSGSSPNRITVSINMRDNAD